MQIRETNRKQRYLGMTATQVTIVAMMAVMTCGVFGLLGWVVIRSSATPSLAGGTDQQTAQPQATSTLPPTRTPVPMPVLEPGWVLLERPAAGFVLAIPGTWVEMDMGAETMDAAVAPIKAYYPDFAMPLVQYQTMEELHAAGLELLAVDATLGRIENVYVGAVNVACEQSADGEAIQVDVEGILRAYEQRDLDLDHRAGQLASG